MAKLYFRYGAMNSAKTANLLMVYHNYMSQGKAVFALKPGNDTRWDEGEEGDSIIRSRALSDKLQATLVKEDQNIIPIITEKLNEQHIDAILVDEAQFLTASQIRELAVIANEYDIPILCYGLRCSYVDGALFEGSAALMYWADTLEELKTVCMYCKSKATKNLLWRNGVPQYSGERVVMGDITGEELRIEPVCRKHYLNPPIVNS